MNEAGLIVITAFISPFRDDRAMARDIIGTDRFREIHVSTSLATCESRDPKGLYRQARSGTVAEFTGISSPYEPPQAPDLTIDTGVATLPEAVAALIEMMAR